MYNWSVGEQTLRYRTKFNIYEDYNTQGKRRLGYS